VHVAMMDEEHGAEIREFVRELLGGQLQ